MIKEALLRALTRIVKRVYATKLHRHIRLLEEMGQPIFETRGQKRSFKILCSNSRSLYRAETYFTKEPETLLWIDGMNSGESFIDIGANIGLYSLYAGAKGLKAIALEPEFHNYQVLNENILLNKLQDNVSALNLAITDRDQVDFLYIPKPEAGSSINAFGNLEILKERKSQAVYRQAVLGLSLDSLIEKYLRLDTHFHLKIDTDGLETQIIQGAVKTIRNPNLKSILIEIDERIESQKKIDEILKLAGFKLSGKVDARESKGQLGPVNRIYFRN